jgi:hypothetical protein
MDQFTEASGTIRRKGKDMVFKNGKTALNTLESGTLTKLMALGSYYTLMETSMKDSGWMIWLMGRGNIHMQMALSMMETGSKTNKKASVKRCGLMEPGMKETSRME